MIQRTSRIRHRWRAYLALFCFGLAFALGFIILLTTETGDAPFEPVRRETPLLDLLGWLPANPETLRGYAAWVAQPDAPLGLADALDQLALEPVPLAIGRSNEWQRITGISASQLTGWASAGHRGATVLIGTMSLQVVEEHLTAADYERTSYRGVTLWRAPTPLSNSQIVQGDDLRSLNVIAITGDRVVIGPTDDQVMLSLEAAMNEVPSLASEPVSGGISLDPPDSGLMVVDQRDLAIACGVGGPWMASDFNEPSGRMLAIVFRQDPATSVPITSVWMQYGEDLLADVALPRLDNEWRTGFVNRQGVGGRISDLTAVGSVYRSDVWVVADLVSGRDNGWTRTGVRFLVGLCEDASMLIPVGSPNRATPVASPSPQE